ncbi:MAG: cold-shock protein [Thermomicrobiales bacterium]
MATGRITSIRADKGFGFIKEASSSSNGNDLFFHRSSVVGTEFEDLREGQDVTFEAGPDPRDPSRFRATNVQTTSGGDA